VNLKGLEDNFQVQLVFTKWNVSRFSQKGHNDLLQVEREYICRNMLLKE
jgi:hypothetical protein